MKAKSRLVLEYVLKEIHKYVDRQARIKGNVIKYSVRLGRRNWRPMTLTLNEATRILNDLN